MDKIIKKCDTSTTSEQSPAPSITQQLKPRSQAAHATVPATRSQATPATKVQTSKSVMDRVKDFLQLGRDETLTTKVEGGGASAVSTHNSKFKVGSRPGMIGSGRKGDEQLIETIQAVQYAGPEAVTRERIEEERKALKEMKSQHEQRQHHYEQYHDNYQVIEGGRESIVEDNYVQISPYTSSSEQDNERRGYEPQSPNLPAMAEGRRVPHQSKPSPRDQHYINERGEGTSLPSYLNDGSHDIPPNHSPHSSRCPPSPPPPRDPPHPPPTDPHHQFTIGSMVCFDVWKGEPLYGVLQWVGVVPGFTGTIAGVELVSDYEKCVYYLIQLIGAVIKRGY